VRIVPGEAGLSCLVAYDAATPSRDLLHRVDRDGMPEFRETVSPPASSPQAFAGFSALGTEATS